MFFLSWCEEKIRSHKQCERDPRGGGGLEESEEWKSHHLKNTVRMPLDLLWNLPEALKTQVSANSLASLSALSQSLHCFSVPFFLLQLISFLFSFRNKISSGIAMFS